MDALLHDVICAVRRLRKAPAFTFAAVLTLALGIGATTLVFTVVDAAILRPLPCPSPDQIVVVMERHPQRGLMAVRPANYIEWRARAKTMARSHAQFPISFAMTGEEGHVSGTLAGEGYFETWGVSPRLGRGFVPHDYADGARPEFFGNRGTVAILSDGFWKRRFGADPAVVGRSIRLDGDAYTVIGIMPPAFRVIDNRDILVPWILTTKEWSERQFHYLPIVSRLREGVTREQAQTEMDGMYRALASDHADDANWTADLSAPRALVLGRTPEVLKMLFGAVVLVLLIACANVSSLLLAQGLRRRQEIAVRLALGSSRAHLVRQLLIEGVLLAFLGAAAGMWIAASGLQIVSRLPAITGLAFTFEPALNGRVLAFVTGVTVVCVLIFACFPAWSQSGVDVSDALKRTARTVRGTHHQLQSFLVIGEVALGVVVVVVTTLMIRSLSHLESVDTGVRTEHVLTMSVSANGSSEAARQFHRRALERVRTLPGVRLAGTATYLPLTPPGLTWRFAIEGHPPPSRLGDESFAVPNIVSHDTLDVLGVRLIGGRGFQHTDGTDSPAVAILGQAAARRYWGLTSPVGQRIKVAGIDPWFTVVGVVNDVHLDKLEESPAPMVYVLDDQVPAPEATLLIQTDHDPELLARSVVRSIRDIDPTQPVDGIRTMDAVRSQALSQPRFLTAMLGSFSALALVLALVGVYGVISQFVAQRREELAIRVAIGATPRDLMTLLARPIFVLIGAGLVCGTLMAGALSQALRAMLFHVQPTDGTSFLTAWVAFVVISVVASFRPVRRAARIDPLLVLRAE
jgi:putative ABC transport system permease protein